MVIWERTQVAGFGGDIGRGGALAPAEHVLQTPKLPPEVVGFFQRVTPGKENDFRLVEDALLCAFLPYLFWGVTDSIPTRGIPWLPVKHAGMELPEKLCPPRRTGLPFMLYQDIWWKLPGTRHSSRWATTNYSWRRTRHRSIDATWLTHRQPWSRIWRPSHPWTLVACTGVWRRAHGYPFWLTPSMEWSCGLSNGAMPSSYATENTPPPDLQTNCNGFKAGF